MHSRRIPSQHLNCQHLNSNKTRIKLQSKETVENLNHCKPKTFHQENVQQCQTKINCIVSRQTSKQSTLTKSDPKIQGWQEPPNHHKPHHHPANTVFHIDTLGKPNDAYILHCVGRVCEVSRNCASFANVIFM